MKKIIFLICFLTAVHLSAQDYKFHATFIYNFTKYIQWPPSYSQGDFVIGVVGDCELIDYLNTLAQSKKAGNQSFKIVKYNSPGEINNPPHIVFIPKTQSSKLPVVLGKVASGSTLVITEEAGLGAQGSGINFVFEGGKPRFELNLDATNAARLKVSSELQRLATVI